MSQHNPVNDFTETAMKNLRALVDVNTVIGDPITTSGGTTILPISKVSFGYGTGGSDLPVQAPDKFLGGTGGGVTLTPIAFLVIQQEEVQLLQLDTADNTGDRMVNAGAGIVDRLLDFIPTKGKKKSDGITPPAEDVATKTTTSSQDIAEALFDETIETDTIVLDDEN